MRQAFLNALPSWWFPYCCRVTKDGEHPNALGTDIEATAFSQVPDTRAHVTLHPHLPHPIQHNCQPLRAAARLYCCITEHAVLPQPL